MDLFSPDNSDKPAAPPTPKPEKAPSVANASSYSAADIEVLEGLEPVRRRPGMYIGGTDTNALHHLFAEVIDNSMDEAIAGHASRIEVHLGHFHAHVGRGVTGVADALEQVAVGGFQVVEQRPDADLRCRGGGRQAERGQQQGNEEAGHDAARVGERTVCALTARAAMQLVANANIYRLH